MQIMKFYGVSKNLKITWAIELEAKINAWVTSM